MRSSLVRAAVLALLAPLALAGAFGHVDGLGLLSHGTQLFAPEHPEHAPFVPQREHACGACAVANLLPPASAPVFLAPPPSRPSSDARADRAAPAPSFRPSPAALLLRPRRRRPAWAKSARASVNASEGIPLKVDSGRRAGAPLFLFAERFLCGLFGLLALAAGPSVAQTAPAAQTGNVFNPAISVIGNALGFVGHNEVDNQPSLQLKESEVGLQAVVDPYARADFFVTFSNEEVGIEEGTITFLSLPWDFLAKAGKFKAAFGKVNTEHPHVRQYADTPLVVLNLLGGEDGINDAGVSVSRLIPMPAEIFLEATAQLFRGTSENLFEAETRNDVEPLFHLKGYKDLSESTNLEIGGSWTRGNGVEGPGLHTTLAGVDLSFRWKPLRQGLYRSLLVRGEWMQSERETAAGPTVRADGFYLLCQYQFGRRWNVGYRHDESDHANDGTLRDRGDSAILTFLPSEFSLIRAQLRRNRYERTGLDTHTATELLVQLQFVIGAHGAHPF